MANYIASRLDAPQIISNYCENKETVFQCGGNVGVYPKLLSKIFQKVITCEPESLNFECLLLNCPENNITKLNVALGADNKMVSLRFDENNCGGHGVIESHGNIKMITIDSLNLDSLDLLMIDVEGFEIELLKGAIETIKKFHPIICSEVAWSNCSDFLSTLGYDKIGENDVDWIFKYNG